MSIPNDITMPFGNKPNLSAWLADMPSQQRVEFMQLVYQKLAKQRAQKFSVNRKPTAHSE